MDAAYKHNVCGVDIKDCLIVEEIFFRSVKPTPLASFERSGGWLANIFVMVVGNG